MGNFKDKWDVIKIVIAGKKRSVILNDEEKAAFDRLKEIAQKKYPQFSERSRFQGMIREIVFSSITEEELLTADSIGGTIKELVIEYLEKEG